MMITKQKTKKGSHNNEPKNQDMLYSVATSRTKRVIGITDLFDFIIILELTNFVLNQQLLILFGD